MVPDPPCDSDENPAADVRLRAAVGYFELGMLEQAWEELDGLPDAVSCSTAANRVRLMLLLKEQRWERALETSRHLCALDPRSPFGFIHAAFCLHELGDTPGAEATLRRGPPSLQEEPVFFYNLGCYRAAQGDHEGAVHLLRRSFGMDRRLRKVAENDPDLEAIRGRL